MANVIDTVERHVARDFPEYKNFFTGETEIRKAKILNALNNPEIDIVEEIKRGKFGDVLDCYIALKFDELSEKTFIGMIKKHFHFKRLWYDRNFLLKQIKRALNGMTVIW